MFEFYDPPAYRDLREPSSLTPSGDETMLSCWRSGGLTLPAGYLRTA